jgi:hypothetical protein
MANPEISSLPRRAAGSCATVSSSICCAVWVDGKVWKTKAGLGVPALFHGAETTRSIVCRANELKG